MDFLFIEKLVEELHSKLRKERLGEVLRGEKTFSFRFGSRYLNFYWGVPNALFLDEKPIATQSFPKLHRIKGSFVKSVAIPVVDRVVEVELVKPLPAGKFDRFFLVFELTGRNANLFLLDSSRQILYLARVPESSVRPLNLGDLYCYPPSDKLPFDELRFGKVSPEGVAGGLHRFVKGISPLNSREIAFLLEKAGSLNEAYSQFLEQHKASSRSYLYYQDGKPKYLTTFPYGSLSNMEFREFGGKLPFSSAWREYYRSTVEKSRLRSLKEKLLSQLDKKISSLKREIEKLSDVEKLKEDVDKWRMWGELLKYNLHLVTPGQRKVEVYDFSTGREVFIPLDPALSPVENLDLFFKNYRKARNRLSFARERLTKLRQELEKLGLLRESIQEKESIEELELFMDSRKERKEPLPGFLTFTLPSGRKILVGRNASENEFISLKLANPWDVWFHAKGIPGSHVVLRLQKGEVPAEEDLILASAAAAYFSKGRDSGKVTVDYTQVRNLRKPPGTPKGFVVYSGEKSITVDPGLFERVEKPPEGGRMLLVHNDDE